MMKSQRHAADTLEYLERLIELAKLEVERTVREEPHYHKPARMHLRHLSRARELFLRYGGDLAEGFKRFQDLGYLERTTIHPGEVVSGYLYTTDRKAADLFVKVKIKGIDYLFEWKASKKK